MTTSPLAKSWTTLEGIGTVVLSAAAAVLSSIDPSKLPPTWAGAFATVSLVTLTLQRGLIKRAALQQPAPAAPTPAPSPSLAPPAAPPSPPPAPSPVAVAAPPAAVTPPPPAPGGTP